MVQNFNLNIKKYIRDSSKYKKMEWWNLPDTIKLQLKESPNDIQTFGNFTTIKRLKLSNLKKEITNEIIGIKKEMMGSNKFKIKFPILLNNIHYVKLYALMTSEGSYRTEFSLNVPEQEFHILFKNCIENLISHEAMELIKSDYNSGFPRSRAPAILRYLLPFPDYIPKIILTNKKYAKEYLRVAFEAEGSPILNKKYHKRYIKLTRNTNITPFVINENDLPSEKRVYINEIKKIYPKLYDRINDIPPKLLLGEHILLKSHFDIDSKLQLEAIRKNKTDFRCGKISARWVLFIYANNIDKYIKQIGFISKRKNEKLNEMKKIKGNRPQYSTLGIIQKISDKDGYFYTKDFVKQMKQIGYKYPCCYLARYCKKSLIKRIKNGFYQISF